MCRFAALAILLVPLVASAEPADFYGRAGIGLGGFSPPDFGGGVVVYDFAAAARLGDVWLRGALTVAELGYGSSDQLYEPHAGIEWRADRPHTGAFIGIDAGWARGDGYVEDGSRFISAPFVMPRGGLEFGGAHVRVQLTLELAFGYGRFIDTSVSPAPVDERTQMGGANLELGLIVR
ncbi:MAG: hypothetical protein JO257_16340 [Deltaproteobacteria bacterium]|nr:hypothetical protein [Deltaproteobacteria bacterium]